MRVGAALAEWSRSLRGYAVDHAPDIEVVLVRDHRAATDGGFTVVCLDLDTVWVTAAFVARLQAAGTVVVGMFADDREQQQWIDWEVAHRVRIDVAAEHVVFLLDTLRPRVEPPRPPSDSGAATTVDEAGTQVTVGGPSGSGAREVAVGLADRFAGDGSTVVVDCNETGGTLAARLGYREHPNLLNAVPAAEADGELVKVVASPATDRPGVPFDLIAGLPSAGEWSRVSPGGVQLVIDACRRRWSTVVVVTGPCVEDMSRWVDRYAISRTLLNTTAPVVGVCAASPRGVLSFANWLADTRPVVPVQVILNKVPAGSGFVRGEVFDRLRSLCGDRIELIGALPWDRRVLRAEWDGTLVRRGPYTRALDRAAGALSLDATALVSQ